MWAVVVEGPVAARPPVRLMRLERGTIVRHANAAEWGRGFVLGTPDGHIDVFFLGAGHRRLRRDGALLAPAAAYADERPLLDLAASLPTLTWTRARHNVYVVALADSVRKDAEFRERNGAMRTDLPCYYVGLTGHSPEKRLAQHLKGYKANRYVLESGARKAALCPQRYSHFNPLPFEFGALFEPYLAEALRRRGHGVWQN